MEVKLEVMFHYFVEAAVAGKEWKDIVPGRKFWVREVENTVFGTQNPETNSRMAKAVREGSADHKDFIYAWVRPGVMKFKGVCKLNWLAFWKKDGGYEITPLGKKWRVNVPRDKALAIYKFVAFHNKKGGVK